MAESIALSLFRDSLFNVDNLVVHRLALFVCHLNLNLGPKSKSTGGLVRTFHIPRLDNALLLPFVSIIRLVLPLRGYYKNNLNSQEPQG